MSNLDAIIVYCTMCISHIMVLMMSGRHSACSAQHLPKLCVDSYALVLAVYEGSRAWTTRNEAPPPACCCLIPSHVLHCSLAD